MFETIANTSIYKNLNLNKNLTHSYLFYSSDKELNNILALFFAKTLLCDSNSGCDNCNSCKQFDVRSHPDLTILKQDSIKVEDITKIINKLNTLPISADKKVFVILNAETINEIAQNKLLKSLEEPNSKNVFILTTTKTDKLLKTVLSRLNKIYIPHPNLNDKKVIASELKKQNIDIENLIDSDLSLTDIINISTDSNFQNTIDEIFKLFKNLNTSSDIPFVVNSLSINDKTNFYTCFQDIILSCIKDDCKKYDKSLIDMINSKFPKKALLKTLPLIEDAYKKQMANVNFYYILDNLLFNILKEKFYATN